MRLAKRSSAGGKWFSSAVSPQALGVGRAAAGVAMITRPSALTGLLGVDQVAQEQTAWVVQMLGAREVAVGAGSILGLRGDRRAGRLWLMAGIVCDVVDAVALATAVKGKQVPPLQGGAVVAVAAGAVGIGVAGLARR